MIRARLAVFMAAAIVFAPGTGFGNSSPQSSASDVAARMLAPTFVDVEIAAYHSAALGKKAQEQERRHSNGLLSIAALVGAFWLANSRSSLLRSDRIQRQLRHVVTSHKDRGPPHLQLV